MGGALGSILLGALTDKDVGGVEPSGELFGKQFAAVLIAAVYSYAVSILLLMAIGVMCRLKPTAVEIMDMDHSQHGESAYLDALEGRRHLHEVDAEAHRCAKFFFTLVEGKNAEIVTRAICANVENELGLALSQAEVAAWLGKSTAGVQPA